MQDDEITRIRLSRLTQNFLMALIAAPYGVALADGEMDSLPEIVVTAHRTTTDLDHARFEELRPGASRGWGLFSEHALLKSWGMYGASEHAAKTPESTASDEHHASAVKPFLVYRDPKRGADVGNPE